ncbi:N-acetyltransferase [Rosistilla oblonga]|uniref:N-acetyltransferase n=1 Tax=Rosistilla oblonga TaxID=2527990 RepID=UPI003A985122
MTETLKIWPVQSSKDQKQFLSLPWQIYRGDENWIPPIRSHQREMVNFKPHPFYQDAEIQTFLAARGNKVVGRIAALVNHAHNRQFDEQRGFFGFFECEDDQEAATGLFEAAAKWLADKGMDAMRGPVNPSLNYECGLLIDGFDRPPTFMMTYNRPYYPTLVESFGLAKVEDLYAYDVELSMLDNLDPKLKFVVEEVARRFEVETRPLSRKNFMSDVRLFLDIYNKSLVNTWGYVPLSEAEIDHQSKQLRMLVTPEMTSIASIKGKPIGACFGLLDYNPLIKKIDGKLFPFGWLRLLLGRRHLKRARLLSTNVLPEYQRWGLGVVTIYRILPDALKFGLTEGELSWVLESNQLSRASIERGGAQITKTYRLYDRDLADFK